MLRRKVIFLSLLIALGLLLTVFAIKLADGTFTPISGPTITASPEATLRYPEPQITAAPDAKIPKAAEPQVTTEPAPVAAPNIPVEPPVSTYQVTPYTPFYQAPKAQPQYPLTAPQPPLSQPIVPSPVQPLPPVVPKPVEGLIAPLAPVTDPLLGPVKDILPPLPKTIEVGIELHEPDIETLLPH